MIDIELVLGIVGGFTAGAGVIWRKYKPLLIDAIDFLVLIRDAAEDDKVTEEEFQQIMAASKPFIAMVSKKYNR